MKTGRLLSDCSLPILVGPDPQEGPLAPAGWVSGYAEQIKALVTEAGVVLIRGLEIDGPQAFRSVCAAIEPDLRSYTAGDSPRTGLADKVYTSTEYDASLEVLLHNELSYAGWSPRLVFFGCLQPATTGGETQIADGRAIYTLIPTDIRNRFEEKKIIYLQHLWDAEGEPGIGKSWQETFETHDRSAAEQYLQNAGMEWDWTSFGLRTRARHDAAIDHPETGERCWWNQADQWHRGLSGVKTSFGAADDPRFDPLTAGEETLGNHVVFGDGSEISTDDLLTIRKVSSSLEVAFPWQSGDVMVIDNILAMHGRKPYTGSRSIVVAMA